MRAALEAIGYGQWILPLLLLLPLGGAAAIWLATPHGADALDDPDPVRARGAARPRRIAAWTLTAWMGLGLGLWPAFDASLPGWQFVADAPWLPDFGARFTVGMDGLSLTLVLLTLVLMPVSVFGAWDEVRTRTKSYYALTCLLASGLVGAFVATDVLLFYVAWEVMLVPMYLIIGIWGGTRRLEAALKFVLFTIFGSLLMLVAIIVLWRESGTQSFAFDLLLDAPPLDATTARWLFGAFFLAFAVKIPLAPLHTWLADAHTEAPTGASVLLAGVMLKVGAYGVMRFAVPLFPAAALEPYTRMVILVLAVVGILYGSLLALAQRDLKRLVAYSSVSHMGFVVLGIFAQSLQSVEGAMLMMLAHGLSAAALFVCVGVVKQRTGTRQLDALGGLARVAPLLSAALALSALASLGLPGTAGFVSEFLVLFGTWRAAPWLTIAASGGLVLAAVYVLWALQRVIFNPLGNPSWSGMPDLSRRELSVLGSLAVLLLWIGVHPAPILRRLEPAAVHFLVLSARGGPATAPTLTR
ncbi:MAG: NADH-quinone oxidoreductase subunit M [Gemmatimonadaceae bacterium]|nr:NADH-quinone oxidoreductase subunit M [Gemmatimonadaceae bacterium]